MPRTFPPFLVQPFPPRPLTAPAPGSSELPQMLAIHAAPSRDCDTCQLSSYFILAPGTEQALQVAERSQGATGTGEEVGEQGCLVMAQPLPGRSGRKWVPEFLRRLGPIGRLCGCAPGISRHELRRSQRWRAFRNEMWHFWRQKEDVSGDETQSSSEEGAFLKMTWGHFGREGKACSAVRRRPFWVPDMVGDEHF